MLNQNLTKMETKIELITPERAKKMLEHNTMNRMPSNKIVYDYARQMRNGIWFEYTGESIKFAEDGTLLDGAQRLLALIEAKTSLNFKVDYGIDKMAFKYIDIGKRRTPGDIFQCAKVPNSRNMAAGIRRYLALKSYKSIVSNPTLALDKTRGVNQSGGGINTIYSTAEMLSIYEKSPKIWNGAHLMAENWYSKSGRLLNLSEYIAFYMFFRDINEDDAYDFMTKVGEGINLSFNDPVKLLRERLTTSKQNPILRLSGYVATALVIKAWNYYRDKTAIKLLRFSPALDNFPRAH